MNVFWKAHLAVMSSSSSCCLSCCSCCCCPPTPTGRSWPRSFLGVLQKIRENIKNVGNARRRGALNWVSEPNQKWHPPMGCSLIPWFQKYPYLWCTSKEIRAPAIWSLCTKTSLRAVHKPPSNSIMCSGGLNSWDIPNGTPWQHSPTLQGPPQSEIFTLGHTK